MSATVTKPSKAAEPSTATLLQKAGRHLRDGAPDAAGVLYREVLSNHPKNKTALAGLADITAKRPALPQGKTAEDQAALDAVAMANQQGDSAAVVSAGASLIGSYPNAALLRTILGVALGKTGQQAAAIAQLEVAEALRPDFADAAYNLGVVFQDIDKRAEAIAAYSRALDADPTKADAWNNIGAIMKLAENIPAAHQAFDRAVQINPQLVEAWNNRGHMRQLLGDILGAISDYQEALKLDPAHVKVYFNIAHALKLIGEKDAAKTCLWEVLKLDPNDATAARELSRVVSGDEIDRLRPYVQDLIAPSHTPEIRMHASYATAYLAFEDGDLATGMDFLNAAGGIAKALKGYRTQNDAAVFATLKASFDPTPEVEITAKEGAPTPIFIVGMPRSGTSLMEEILSRHSDVSGGGELEYLNRAINRSGIVEAGVTEETLAAIREPYLDALGTHQRPGTQFVTDKMPINFRFLGHIALAFPEAKIIHMRRAPEAVCWSNFQIFFPSDGMAFSSTQADIAAYYRLYDDLMSFWDERFGDRIVHVDYQGLTEAPEETTKGIVDAIGLPWQDGLTDVESSARSVHTASALQVKQGIYTGSSDAWRRFEPWLGEMLEGLGDLAGQS